MMSDRKWTKRKTLLFLLFSGVGLWAVIVYLVSEFAPYVPTGEGAKPENYPWPN